MILTGKNPFVKCPGHSHQGYPKKDMSVRAGRSSLATPAISSPKGDTLLVSFRKTIP